VENEKPDEVLTSDEDKQYRTFLLDGFRIKTGVEALDNFKDKIKGKTDTETKMRAWTQGKMRLRDPKKPAENGAFDKACKRLQDYIFKAEMQEAKKQRKLTDEPIEKEPAKEITITHGKYKYTPEPAYREVNPNKRCQKCHGPHKVGAKHKFEPAARGRGRPARKG